MPKRHQTRSGSLQFWPRKKAKRTLPSVNWNVIEEKNKQNLHGFIAYKVGMFSAFVKDNTDHSMTKGKKIAVPVTVLECPEMKIYSIRLYKNKRLLKDLVVGFDEELKSKIKKPKQFKQLENLKDIDFDDVRILTYSNVKKTNIKKVPDLIELSLGGSKEEKLNFVKDKINKDIKVSEVFSEGLVDVRGVTKGHGTQGPVKRFGIGLKFHKSEKGQRRPGSLGPWHPARVTFRVPISGQTGYFTRISYNSLIIKVGHTQETDINRQQGFHKFGNIKTGYIILKGSVPGPKKRAMIITSPIRPTKSAVKKKFELLELR
ncbi:MAG: 50S ribosomal protein L3 [Nanoarchaeota archaeon]